MLGDGTVEQYQYAANSNRLQQVASGQGTRSFSYDARGSIQQDRRVGTAGNYSYRYNAAGRMMSVTKNGAVVASYGYDATGHRVTKLIPGASGVVTIYDRSGGVLGEYTNSGTVLTESIWLGGELLAQVQGGQANYALTDHLGTPFLLTDSHQSVVWQSVADPFGVPVRITGPASLSQRFPGQHADAETGLNQNYFRDYDPMIGRYIQSDPIGLLGGRNTYGYVGGNPVRYVDEKGLCPACVMALGSAEGGVAGGPVGIAIGVTGAAGICLADAGCRQAVQDGAQVAAQAVGDAAQIAMDIAGDIGASIFDMAQKGRQSGRGDALDNVRKKAKENNCDPCDILNDMMADAKSRNDKATVRSVENMQKYLGCRNKSKRNEQKNK